MAHAPARTAAGTQHPAPESVRCVECPAPLTGSQPGQLFCCDTHRAAFQQRQRIRGRQLLIYAMADRQTRSGTAGTPERRETGKTARAVTQRLIAKWTEEDKAAGRMPAIDYLTRFARHFDLPL